MTYINWDKPFLFNVDGITIPVPTYGNYGGAGYSSGGDSPLETKKNGKALPDKKLADNVDDLDYLFYKHDVATDRAQNAKQEDAADLALIRGIANLSDEQLADPEASLYAGLASVTISALLLERNPSLAESLIPYLAEAVDDIVTGLAGLDPVEQRDALTYLTGQPRNATPGVVDFLEGVDLGEPINTLLDTADAYLDILNSGFPVIALSSYDLV